MNQIPTTYLYDCRAGTGKTTKIRELAGNLESSFLYISFNKKLADSMTENSGNRNIFNKSNAKTFHKYAYSILRYNNMAGDFDFTDNNKSIDLSDQFDSIIDKTLDEFEKEKLGFLYRVNTIFVDEYQDLSYKMLKILCFVQKRIGCTIHFFGDDFQDIYEFGSGSSKSSFKSYQIKALFPHAISSQLKINYRSTCKINSSIQNFINDFSERKIEIQSSKVSQNYDMKPKLTFFDSVSLEFEEVKKKVLKTNSKSIAIISLTNRSLLPYLEDKEICEKLGKSNITTIHAAKGKEFEVVFVVNLQSIEKSTMPKYLNIFYVALSRAKSRLYLSTAYPSEYFVSSAYKNCFEISGKQNAIPHTMHFRRKVKSKKSNFSLQKLKKSSIDSLILAIGHKHLSFLPYIENQFIPSKKKIGKFIKQQKIEGEITYTIKYHCAHRKYFFEFFDLNPLKKSSFTDLDIIRYLFKIMYDFFGKRISASNIEVVRSDTYILYDLSNIVDRALLNKELDAFQDKKFKGITQTHKKKEVDLSELTLGFLNNLKDTLYLNLTADRSECLVLYILYNKENENRFHNKNIIKVEKRTTPRRGKRESLQVFHDKFLPKVDNQTDKFYGSEALLQHA